MLHLRSGKHLRSRVLPSLLGADGAGASGRIAKCASQDGCGDRSQRRGQDRILGYAYGHAVATGGKDASPRPRRVFNHLAANHDRGLGPLRFGQNIERRGQVREAADGGARAAVGRRLRRYQDRAAAGRACHGDVTCRTVSHDDDLTGRQAEVFPEWKQRMLELAALPNVVVKLGGLEIQLETLNVENAAESPLPIDPFAEAQASQDLRMDWRYLDLRRKENLVIFEIETTVEMAMRHGRALGRLALPRLRPGHRNRGPAGL